MTDQSDTTLNPTKGQTADNPVKERKPSDWVVAKMKSASNRRSKQPEHPLGDKALTTVPPGFEVAGTPSLQLMWLAALRFGLQAKHHELIEKRDSLDDYEAQHAQILYDMDYVDAAMDRGVLNEFGIDGKRIAAAFQADWTMLYRQLPDSLAAAIQAAPFGLRSAIDIDAFLNDHDDGAETDGDDILTALKKAATGDGTMRARVVVGSPELAALLKEAFDDEPDVEVEFGGSMSGERLAALLGGDAETPEGDEPFGGLMSGLFGPDFRQALINGDVPGMPSFEEWQAARERGEEPKMDPMAMLRGAGIADDLFSTGGTIKNMLDDLRQRKESGEIPSFEEHMRGKGLGHVYDAAKRAGLVDDDGMPKLSAGRQRLFDLMGKESDTSEEGGSPTNLGDTFGNKGPVHAGEGDQVNVERIELGITINLHLPNPLKKRKKKKKSKKS